MYSVGSFISWLLEGAVGALFFGEDARPQKYAIVAILMTAALWLIVRGYSLHSTWTSRLLSDSTKWGALLLAWAFAIAFFARGTPSGRGTS
jgi:EamA domain-containing membrane protein RarD